MRAQRRGTLVTAALARAVLLRCSRSSVLGRNTLRSPSRIHMLWLLIICLADLTCQSVLECDQAAVDLRRTAALTLFGAWHYGVPAKSLYLLYDRLLGSAPTLANAVKKMLLDVYVHTPHCFSYHPST